MLAVFVFGITGSVLVPMLQTRLMDVARDGQSLAAALNHSTLNLANALGAWIGGLVLDHGLGYEWPSRVGGVLALAGLAVALVVRLAGDLGGPARLRGTWVGRRLVRCRQRRLSRPMLSATVSEVRADRPSEAWTATTADAGHRDRGGGGRHRGGAVPDRLLVPVHRCAAPSSRSSSPTSPAAGAARLVAGLVALAFLVLVLWGMGRLLNGCDRWVFWAGQLITAGAALYLLLDASSGEPQVPAVVLAARAAGVVLPSCRRPGAG